MQTTGKIFVAAAKFPLPEAKYFLGALRPDELVAGEIPIKNAHMCAIQG